MPMQLCEGVATSGQWTEKLGAIVKEVHSRRSVGDRGNGHHCALHLMHDVDGRAGSWCISSSPCPTSDEVSGRSSHS
ncbi:hypothetical protein MRX96_041098 [Rhipicephalus microplus]